MGLLLLVDRGFRRAWRPAEDRGRVDVGHADGTRRRVTVYGKTEREVLGKLRGVVKAKERGQDGLAGALVR